MYEEKEEFDKRDKILKKLTQLIPKSGDDWTKKEFACELLKKQDKTLYCYKQAMEVEPANPQNLRYAGDIYFEKKDL